MAPRSSHAKFQPLHERNKEKLLAKWGKNLPHISH